MRSGASRTSTTTNPLAPIADRIGSWLLRRDIEARIETYAAAWENPEVLAAATLGPD